MLKHSIALSNPSRKNLSPNNRLIDYQSSIGSHRLKEFSASIKGKQIIRTKRTVASQQEYYQGSNSYSGSQ